MSVLALFAPAATTRPDLPPRTPVLSVRMARADRYVGRADCDLPKVLAAPADCDWCGTPAPLRLDAPDGLIPPVYRCTALDCQGAYLVRRLPAAQVL